MWLIASISARPNFLYSGNNKISQVIILQSQKSQHIISAASPLLTVPLVLPNQVIQTGWLRFLITHPCQTGLVFRSSKSSSFSTEDIAAWPVPRLHREVILMSLHLPGARQTQKPLCYHSSAVEWGCKSHRHTSSGVFMGSDTAGHPAKLPA